MQFLHKSKTKGIKPTLQFFISAPPYGNKNKKHQNKSTAFVFAFKSQPTKVNLCFFALTFLAVIDRLCIPANLVLCNNDKTILI